MAMQNEQRLAVLIDADNASNGNLKAIMDEVAKYGVPTIKHAYGGAGSHVWVKDKEAK